MLRAALVFALIFVTQGATAAQNKKPAQLPRRLISAKSIYLDDQTGAPNVGAKALDELRKWGRFEMASGAKQADVILLLSNGKYDGYLDSDTGHPGIEQDDTRDGTEGPTPIWRKQSITHVAFLTAIDPETGDALWSDSRPWGGLLTGFDSAGWRLIDEFRKDVEKGSK